MQSDSPQMTTSGGAHLITPSDFFTIYNLPNGLTGAGVNIGIAAFILTITSLLVAAQETTPAATSDKASCQLLGTVVDTSGAFMAGAIVQVRTPDGTMEGKTQTGRNGAFILQDSRPVLISSSWQDLILEPKKCASP